jgi:hypothetical protein
LSSDTFERWGGGQGPSPAGIGKRRSSISPSSPF